MLDKEKARLNDVLNNESGDALGWAVTIFIVVLIVISVAVAILDTLEELPAEVKNNISHRAIAFKEFSKFLRKNIFS